MERNSHNFGMPYHDLNYDGSRLLDLTGHMSQNLAELVAIPIRDLEQISGDTTSSPFGNMANDASMDMSSLCSVYDSGIDASRRVLDESDVVMSENLLPHSPADIRTLRNPIQNAERFMLRYIQGPNGEFISRYARLGSDIVSGPRLPLHETPHPQIPPAPCMLPKTTQISVPKKESVLGYGTTSRMVRISRFPTTREGFKARNKPVSKRLKSGRLSGIGEPRNKRKSSDPMNYPCYRCTLMGKSCKYTEGKDACDACIRKWTSGSDAIVINPQEKHLHINVVLWFSLKETHATLIELWEELSETLGPRGKNFLQEIPWKSIVCSMSCDASPTPFSNRHKPVAISHPTMNVQMVQGNRPPAPALDIKQMNDFNDLQTLDLLGVELYTLQTARVITAALRCSTWLAILFGFDQNAIIQAQDIDEATSKILVLLTMYSIVYEIQRNFKYLLCEAEKSFTSAPDPESFAAALGVVYSFVHTRPFPSSSNTSKALDKFLKVFHERGGYALSNVKRARKLYSTYNCKAGGRDVLYRKKLIELQNELDPVMHLTFEKAESGRLLGIQRTDRSFLPQRTQLQVLEASISSWDRLRYSSKDHPENYVSESSASSIKGLSEENLRRFSKSKPTADPLNDSVSQYTTIYMDSTTIAEEHVEDNAGNFVLPTEDAAENFNEMEFHPIPTLWPTEYLLNGMSWDDDPSRHFFDGKISVDLDLGVQDSGKIVDMEGSFPF